jgi:virginiamycin A acetyltransferase
MGKWGSMAGKAPNRHATAPRERLARLYGNSRASVRRLIVKLIIDTEGGEFYSTTLREIFRVHHGVDIGMYTHGGCFRPYAFGRSTTFGRYTSVAATAFGATDNHPMEYKAMHGFFFNPKLGLVDREWDHSPLTIGNDVWLGHNSIIMPQVNSVGNGAVVGAGAVVFKDVPAYAVVVGNPGRVVRYRFDPATIERLLAEKWWEQDIDEIRPHLDEYTREYLPDAADRAGSIIDPAPVRTAGS